MSDGHRSLAELAGERDRALRSLAAEEDKRHDLIEECNALLGGELSCGDVSRLALSLDRIEQELEQEGEEGGEGGGGRDEDPGGRTWVLKVGCVRLVLCCSGLRERVGCMYFLTMWPCSARMGNLAVTRRAR